MLCRNSFLGLGISWKQNIVAFSSHRRAEQTCGFQKSSILETIFISVILYRGTFTKSKESFNKLGEWLELFSFVYQSSNIILIYYSYGTMLPK